MKTNLVINLILVLLIVSCSTLNQEFKNDSQQVVEEELLRNSAFYKNDKVYVKFNLDDYLIAFIKKNETDSVGDNINLSKHINIDEIRLIFNKEEVKFLVEKLEKTDSKFKSNSLSKNLIFESKEEMVEINEFEIKRINFSNPAITKNKKYSLIAYAYGKKGGINVYHKINNKWRFYKSIDLWFN